ncbi:MAG: HD domain-containing protein, partial [Chloroflexota bacterium]|nr:HD domain-containing protein [Chloroflexota bacterium]
MSEGKVMPTRAEALALLYEWNHNPSLRKHGLLVEAGVGGYAVDDGLDNATVESWGMAGLLHDLDYERFPDPAMHGAIGADEMARLGYPDEVVHAVRSHNDALGIPRVSRLDHLVYACDEMAGFL